jgi:hypothetical protein
MQGSTEKEPLAVPQPVVAPVQPPLAEAETSFLTQEEIKLLEHLRGLQEMGVDLAESMTAQLEKLQLKESQTTAAKALSHGHLNRLHKLRTQVNTAGKIQDLDAEWEKFVQSIMEKMQSHAVMYQKHRSDLLEAYNARMAELQLIKKQVGQASHNLLAQPIRSKKCRRCR